METDGICWTFQQEEMYFSKSNKSSVKYASVTRNSYFQSEMIFSGCSGFPLVKVFISEFGFVNPYLTLLLLFFVLHPLEIKNAWSLGIEVRRLGFCPANEFTGY